VRKKLTATVKVRAAGKMISGTCDANQSAKPEQIRAVLGKSKIAAWREVKASKTPNARISWPKAG